MEFTTHLELHFKQFDSLKANRTLVVVRMNGAVTLQGIPFQEIFHTT